MPKNGPLSNLITRGLRVLLAKRPKMSLPTFFGQCLVFCIVKSAYLVDVPGTKNWDLEANTMPWTAISV